MKIPTCKHFFWPYILFLTFFLAGELLVLANFSDASSDEIALIDSWVEDGFEFHVGFQAPPSNAQCSIYGEGLIEFEVSYFTPASSEKEYVYGVAKWYPASDPKDRVETYGRVLGSQGFCTKVSPCRIKRVRVVKTWCPPIEGLLYPPGWF